MLSCQRHHAPRPFEPHNTLLHNKPTNQSPSPPIHPYIHIHPPPPQTPSGARPPVVDRRAEIMAERKQQREAQRKQFDRERVRTWGLIDMVYTPICLSLCSGMGWLGCG